MSSAVEEWIAKNGGPTRKVTTYWRAMKDVPTKYRNELHRVHRCGEDGKPVCPCGKSADRVGNLDEEVLAFDKIPPNGCDWWSMRRGTRKGSVST